MPMMPSILATANCEVSEVISLKPMPFTVAVPTVTSSTLSMPFTAPEPYWMEMAVPSAFYVLDLLEF